MKTLLITILTIGSLLVNASDESQILNTLKSITENIESIKPFTEKGDLGRLMLLQKTIIKVSDSIATNGMAHNKSMNAFLEMSISFKYSRAFFNSILTQQTAYAINDLLQKANSLSKERGFEESPATQVTANTLNQLARLIEELAKQNIDNDLLKDLIEMKPALGKAIAQARLGDRPLTFEAADAIIRKFKMMYFKLDRLFSSSETFNLVLEIQGLVEFYDEFAQYSERFGKN